MNETSLYFLLVALLLGVFYYLLDLRARRLEGRLAALAREVHGEGAWARLDERIRELTRGATDLEENVSQELSAEGERSRVRLAEFERRLAERLDAELKGLERLVREGLGEPAEPGRGDAESWSGLVERIEALGASFRSRADAHEAELRSLAEALARVAERLETLSQASGRRSGPAVTEESVAALLEDDGFERVTLLGRTQEPGQGAIRYVVEAVRQGVSYKGHVSVKDGAFVERDLRPAYSMFP